MESVGTLPPDALNRAVLEIEKHGAEARLGPARQLFALVATEDARAPQPQSGRAARADDVSGSR